MIKGTYKVPPERMEKLLKNLTRSYWKGKKRSQETRDKMSKSHMGKHLGEKSGFWKGGVADKNDIIRHSTPYKKWRTAVYERDNYTCTKCGVKSGNGKSIVLNADHIKPFSTHPELRFEISNGRTLCVDCHRKTDTYGISLTWKLIKGEKL